MAKHAAAPILHDKTRKPITSSTSKAVQEPQALPRHYKHDNGEVEVVHFDENGTPYLPRTITCTKCGGTEPAKRKLSVVNGNYTRLQGVHADNPDLIGPTKPSAKTYAHYKKCPPLPAPKPETGKTTTKAVKPPKPEAGKVAAKTIEPPKPETGGKVTAKKIDLLKPETGGKVAAKKIDLLKPEADKVTAKTIEPPKPEVDKVTAKRIYLPKREPGKVETRNTDLRRREAGKIETKEITSPRPEAERAEWRQRNPASSPNLHLVKHSRQSERPPQHSKSRPPQYGRGRDFTRPAFIGREDHGVTPEYIARIEAEIQGIDGSAISQEDTSRFASTQSSSPPPAPKKFRTERFHGKVRAKKLWHPKVAGLDVKSLVRPPTHPIDSARVIKSLPVSTEAVYDIYDKLNDRSIEDSMTRGICWLFFRELVGLLSNSAKTDSCSAPGTP